MLKMLLKYILMTFTNIGTYKLIDVCNFIKYIVIIIVYYDIFYTMLLYLVYQK